MFIVITSCEIFIAKIIFLKKRKTVEFRFRRSDG